VSGLEAAKLSTRLPPRPSSLRATVSRNGKHSPPRPRIELRQTNASPEEAAAIAAAIEQFLRDTAPPPPPPPEEAPSGWLTAALREGVGSGEDELFPT
jgi:hypothetical protein